MGIIKPKYYRQEILKNGTLGPIEIFNVIKRKAVVRGEEGLLEKGFHIPSSLLSLTRGIQIRVYGYVWGYIESAPYKEGYEVIDLSDSLNLNE